MQDLMHTPSQAICLSVYVSLYFYVYSMHAVVCLAPSGNPSHSCKCPCLLEIQIVEAQRGLLGEFTFAAFAVAVH